MENSSGTILAHILFFGIVACFACNMADKDKASAINEPIFARLAEGEGSFRVTVYDDKNQYTMKEFSFFGHTAVGGVRRETDDSVTRFELSKMKELKILKPHFDSARFGDKDFLLAEVTSSTGAVVSDLLVPKKLIICGVDEKSGLEKSWFLQKVDRIVVLGVTPLVLPSIPSTVVSNQPVNAAPAPTLAPGATQAQQVLPTAGSQEKTKRTFRPGKDDKWSAFYKNNQMPVGDTQEHTQEKRSIAGAFIAIIDAIIDLVRALIGGIMRLFS